MSLINYSNEKLFDRLLNNKSNKNYWKYISELRKRKSKDIFDKSILLTNSEIVKERIIAIDVLAQFGYPRLHRKLILKTFFRLLKTETDKYALSSLFYGIGHNNEDLTNKEIDLICSFRNHKSSRVRYSLAFALLTKEETKAIETLIELSKDRDSEIRDWATFGIGTQIEIDSVEIKEALWNRINDTNESTRFEAIVGLANRMDKKVKSIIEKELQKEDFSSLLFEAIAKLNAKEFLPILNDILKSESENENTSLEWLNNLKDCIKKLDEK